MESHIPFIDRFMRIVIEYNFAIEPMQYVAYALGIIAVLLAAVKAEFARKYVSLILAIFWIWIGFMFCILYWSQIYPLAHVLGVLFIIQGLLFLIFGFFRQDLSFHTEASVYTTLGFIFIVYAMVLYPLIGKYLGRSWPAILPFGLVPCPTTPFTFGLLLWANKKVPFYVFVIPLVAAIFAAGAITFGIYEDIGVFIAGVLGTILILVRNRTFDANPKS